MIKTLAVSLKRDKDQFRIPHSVQDAIPIRRIWPDGVFQSSQSNYSRSYRFTDINYAVASKEDKLAMFLDYCEMLNALDSGTCAKITIHNRKVDKGRYEQDLLLPMKADGFDGYRREYNEMLRSKITATSSSVVREQYLTISTHKKNIDEARSYFTRVGGEITARLAKLSSQAVPMDVAERLGLLRDFFKDGKPAAFPFSAADHAKLGHGFKEWFCPDSMEFYADYFKVDSRWGRVLYLRDYASFIKDSFINELCELDQSLMLSIDILPVPTDEAARELQNKLLGIETNVTNWQRRQNNASNFSAVIPYDMQLQRKETTEFLDDLTGRDQRMMFGLVTLVHLADSKEQLDADTESLLAVGGKHRCELSTLRWQQRDGLDTVLPYGVRHIHSLRTLTTESTAVLMPFKAQELCHPDGIYYGQNAVSGNMIRIDRSKLLNGHSFRLGVSGSGKSMSAKEEIVHIALATDDDILILDPESEFGPLAKALGGVVLPISPHSPIHLNALDMDRAYGEGQNPLIDKVQLILSMFEPLAEHGALTARQKSLLDRCARIVYGSYLRSGCTGQPPTLVDLRNVLLAQPEQEAHDLALAAELYTTGSLNTFAKLTNVNTSARILVYDIRELDEQLRPVGMVVTLDAIFNRVIRNWRQGRRTWIVCDEFYLLFRYSYSAEFFYRLFKRLRKYNAYITAVSQNVEEILRSDTARLMLANSEFLVMLNQAATDRDELAKLLNISDNQLSHITNVPAGHGLIRCGGVIVPFQNDFPKDTKLYRLMSTKPDEAWNMDDAGGLQA